MRRILIVLLLCIPFPLAAATFPTGSPSTTNNDDSCDIGVFPAATLLLPYFEVDFSSPQTVARTTLFTIVNHSHAPQIARVTLWTDFAYPVLDFNIFLTGYDVQAINLYDVLGPRGVIPSTSSLFDQGSRSLDNNANPNFLPNAVTACAQLPGPVPAVILDDVRSALTTGTSKACGSVKVGSPHANAAGYATIDLVATCGVKLATDAGYFDEILYDNVLSGDYEWIDPNPATGNYAGGNPLVHIRAIPEGGPPGVIAHTNLPYTFYDRYTNANARTTDRRQPLPSAFASRYIQGGAGAFNTDLRIWREGVTGPNAACADYAQHVALPMKITDIVRFDEHENPTLLAGGPVGPSPRIFSPVILPATSSVPTAGPLFPPMATSGDVAGWIFLNLSNGGSAAYSAARQNQNWVVTSMTAEGRFQVAFDATMLANGCNPAPTTP